MKHAPLTRAQLQAIQSKYLDNKEVMTLLREIKRYQRIFNNCWQVFDTVPPPETNSPFDHLIGLINNEPCVKEQREAYERISALSRKKE